MPSLPSESGNDRLIPQYRRLLRAVRQTDFETPADLLGVLAPFVSSSRDEPSEPSVVQKQWPGGKAQAEAERARWIAFGQHYATPYVQALRRARYRVVLNALRPAVLVYDRLRQEGGWLNFQDLLLAAARLLRESAAIRQYFRKRFTHLLIDEFQDTDPIQAEVMLLLTADDPSETDWRRCRPVAGSLFVVGDPKQSIYRFRRADIVTYNEVKRIIESTGGTVVSLTANFRSASSPGGVDQRELQRAFPRGRHAVRAGLLVAPGGPARRTKRRSCGALRAQGPRRQQGRNPGE